MNYFPKELILRRNTWTWFMPTYVDRFFAIECIGLTNICQMVKLLDAIHRMENLDVMYTDLKRNNFKLLDTNSYCLFDFGNAIQLPKAQGRDSSIREADTEAEDVDEDDPRREIVETSYSL